MTTPRDLLIVTMDVPPARPVEQGDLSLALAGAELADLLTGGYVTLDGDRVVPGARPATGDRLLDEAGAALVDRAPYETVEDWLWRRGRGLAAAYVSGLDAEELPAGQRHRWMPRRTARQSPADSPARREAADRWASREPLLRGLAAAVGVEEPGALPDPGEESLTVVLAAVNHAVTELESVRQRRRIEDAAFDNIWRAP
ncbi:GPP34 family phosphoprotein [Streptomyces anandii]|uniref:GPP34 family phosphoprotein n=1 Tax=Streptomyces anandii TaxID=285454 RepID=A0ABW6HFQ4_9ACTN